MSGCKCWRTSRSAVELPQVEETGCFWCGIAARVGTGVIAISAKPNVTCSTRYAPAADMAAHQLYQQKYSTLSTSIAALQGYHARIKEHIMSRPLLQLALDHLSFEAAQRDDAVKDTDIRSRNHSLFKRRAWRRGSLCANSALTKIIVADWKAADAGETPSRNSTLAQAPTRMTIIRARAAAHGGCHAMAQNCGGEIRSSLFGN